jgi:hypothetical protein
MNIGDVSLSSKGNLKMLTISITAVRDFLLVAVFLIQVQALISD